MSRLRKRRVGRRPRALQMGISTRLDAYPRRWDLITRCIYCYLRVAIKEAWAELHAERENFIKKGS